MASDDIGNKTDFVNTLIVDSLSRIDTKLDRLDDDFQRRFQGLDQRVNNIDVTLARQESQLAEHIRRTNLLEQSLADEKLAMPVVAKEVTGKEIQAEHWRLAGLGLKILAVLIGLGASALGIKEALPLAIKVLGF